MSQDLAVDETFPRDADQWQTLVQFWKGKDHAENARMCQDVCEALKSCGQYVILAEDHSAAELWASGKSFHFVNSMAACRNVHSKYQFVVVRLDNWKNVDQSEREKVENHIRTSTKWLDPKTAAQYRKALNQNSQNRTSNEH